MKYYFEEKFMQEMLQDNKIRKDYERLHRMETDEIVEYAYNLEQQLEQTNKKIETEHNRKIDAQVSLQNALVKLDKIKEYLDKQDPIILTISINLMNIKKIIDKESDK